VAQVAVCLLASTRPWAPPQYCFKKKKKRLLPGWEKFFTIIHYKGLIPRICGELKLNNKKTWFKNGQRNLDIFSKADIQMVNSTSLIRNMQLKTMRCHLLPSEVATIRTEDWCWWGAGRSVVQRMRSTHEAWVPSPAPEKQMMEGWDGTVVNQCVKSGDASHFGQQT
jgi:hypothetical protein